MIMRMDFSPEALNDLESIRDYLLAEDGVKTSEENIKKSNEEHQILDARRDFLSILFGIKTQTDDEPS